MSYNAKKILLDLVDKYDRSIISKQGSQRNIKQKFTLTSKTIPEYFSTSGYQFKQQLNIDLLTYQESKWIELEYDEDSEIITSVTLNPSKIEEINQFLNRKSRNEQEEELLNLLSQYKNTPIDRYVKDVISRIQHYESYQSLVFDTNEENKQLFHALNQLLQLNHEEMERVFSVRVLKDSKQFQKMKSKIIHILKTYFDAEGEDEQILADFNIMKNPSSISMKGNAEFILNHSKIHLVDFKQEFILSASNISNIKIESLPVQRIITIENLTSFYTTNIPDSLIIYLGGYHNQARREFLQLLYQYAPHLDYYHFGDIDAGGIYIFEHLKEKTHIPFQPLWMDIKTLKEYHQQTIPLTKNDRLRLKKIESKEFQEVIQYMLQHNQKLEQENVITKLENIH